MTEEEKRNYQKEWQRRRREALRIAKLTIQGRCVRCEFILASEYHMQFPCATLATLNRFLQ
jgi:hypothetical protein